MITLASKTFFFVPLIGTELKKKIVLFANLSLVIIFHNFTYRKRGNKMCEGYIYIYIFQYCRMKKTNMTVTININNCDAPHEIINNRR